jgi:ethanolamine ammonia-lyase small subunit
MTKPLTVSDAWAHLRQHTQARIAQGRSGHSLPTEALLRFQADHALARDAVYSELALDVLQTQLMALVAQHPSLWADPQVLTLRSQAATRQQYLQRPDWGRKLHASDAAALKPHRPSTLSIVLADGLSAAAINRHAVPVLAILLPAFAEANWRLAPLSIVLQGRVAVADEVGAGLQAQMSLILIGERPGLSSPDSMGAYLTYAPNPGLTDESRNCVSNIRPEGLDYEAAARKLFYLLSEMNTRQLSGVLLKDEMALQLPIGSNPTRPLSD